MAAITAERTYSSTIFLNDPLAARVVPGLVSIIVPVFNEAVLIRRCLTNLRECAPGAEIIVVDGGSTDGTREFAIDLCDRLITTRCSRALQMNEGARAAHGDTLWFLHADVEIQACCLSRIADSLGDRTVAGGYFRIRLPRDRFVYRFTDEFAHYAGILFRVRCGDHGLFCRREVFERLGGFPEVALMEDVEFFRALHRCGRICAIESRIEPSPRRYETIGSVRLTLIYGLIASLYILGARLPFLDSFYRRLLAQGRRSRP
jgi:rSAM/selenodomain-associated transferase 2